MPPSNIVSPKGGNSGNPLAIVAGSRASGCQTELPSDCPDDPCGENWRTGITYGIKDSLNFRVRKSNPFTENVAMLGVPRPACTHGGCATKGFEYFIFQHFSAPQSVELQHVVALQQPWAQLLHCHNATIQVRFVASTETKP